MENYRYNTYKAQGADAIADVQGTVALYLRL
jgi:hypothetical protein